MKQPLPRLMLALFCLFMVSNSPALDSTTLFNTVLTRLDEAPTTLATYQNHPIVINLWARWCGPCRTEIPILNKMNQQYGKQGVKMIGIALDEQLSAVREFSKSYEINYAVLVAKDQHTALMNALGNTRHGIPFTIVLNRQGQIVYQKLGIFDPKELEAAIKASLR